MPTDQERFEHELRHKCPNFKIQLSDDLVARLGAFYQLLSKWNGRLHLVAPCSPEEFATRHVLESLLVLQHAGKAKHLVDIGSGAGLPAIPCLVANEKLRGTLIESAKKKAVFLKEAIRQLDLSGRTEVLAERFEETVADSADLVTCRAIERFATILPELITWSPKPSRLLFFTGEHVASEILGILPDAERIPIPLSDRRFLIKAELQT